VEFPKVNHKPDVAMFNASQIINKTIVQKCKSEDDNCVNNLVYPCMDECPGKKQVNYLKYFKYFIIQSRMNRMKNIII